MKPLIIFDFDGTIVDSIDIIIDSIRTVAERRGYDMDFEHAHLQEKGFEGLLRHNGVSIFRVSSFLSECHDEIAHRIAQAPVHEHMYELIKEISAYADLCVVTSSQAEMVMEYLDDDFLGYFETVLHAGIFSKHKMIRRLRRTHELKKSAVLYVGDESRDVHAARRAGVESLAVTWGIQNTKSLLKSRPSMLAQNATEAEHLIKAWIASR